MRLDPHGNPYLIWTYFELTPTERVTYFRKLERRLIQCKYFYYFKNGQGSPSDAEYDYTERLYEAVAEDLGLDAWVPNMVGFNQARPECAQFLKELTK